MKALERNIVSAISKAKRDKIVGMSVANLKQTTPTRGLTCTPVEYHREFPQIAVQAAKRLKFNLY